MFPTPWSVWKTNVKIINSKPFEKHQILWNFCFLGNFQKNWIGGKNLLEGNILTYFLHFQHVPPLQLILRFPSNSKLPLQWKSIGGYECPSNENQFEGTSAPPMKINWREQVPLQWKSIGGKFKILQWPIGGGVHV